MSTDDMTQDGSAIPGGSETPNRNSNSASGTVPAAVQMANPSGNVSVATTPNLTTMNTNQNHNVPADGESAAFHAQLNNNGGLAPLSSGGRLPQPISGSYSETGNGSMSPISGSFTIPEGGARMTLSLTVDDWGTIEVSGSGGSYSLNMGPSNSYPGGEPGQRGGHQLWSQEESFTLPQGEYQYTVTHENIGMEHEEYNVGVCNYSISFRPVGDSSSSSSSSPSSSSSSYVKEVPICDPCSCGDDNTDGDADHGPSDPAPGVPDDPCQGKTTPGEDNNEGGASPASFARARAARSAANGADDAIVQSIGMRYESTWDWRASLQGSLITIVPPSGAALYFNTQEGSAEAAPAGISRKRDFRVQLQKADLSPCTEGNPAFLLLVDASGQRVRFSVESGEVVAVISAAGKVFTAEQRAEEVKTLFDEEGYLTACYSTTEGLMQVVAQEDGSQRLEWFAAEAVVVNADGSFSPSGEPYKTATYLTTVDPATGARTMTVRRRQRGLPEHVVSRCVNGNVVTIAKGAGDEAIIRTYETNSLFGNMMERIESVRGINDAEPVSCTRELKQFTEGGWLTISRTEAFNTPLARTTTYEYNDQFRVSKETRPDGSTVLYEYDSQSRLTKQTEPWAEGGQRITRQVYATSSSRFYDTRPIKVYTDYRTASGSFLNIAVTNYSYEDSSAVERTTSTTFAAGVSHQQVRIEETYGEAAAYPYAAGKAKFSQAVNGVQTFYEYEATSEHGAAHKRTVTTKANNELEAGQSRKTESFIAANDTVTYEAESIWDGENWLLLSTASHEYDEQQRLVKTTRGNGRVSTKAWMCCGLLSETDEDGIQTDYAYNSVHQQTETTRAAVYDGNTCITPETITEYTRDAAGRILTTTRRVGAMETTESTTYDALGRVVSQTDILDRTTTTAYSEDGLTTTVTTPAGATLTTVRNTDGSVAHVSSTGQRELHYHYDFNNKRMHETVRTAEGDTISQTLTNGFGETVVEGVASTSGALYTRSEYNAKGQLVKQYQDTGSGSTPTAATLYEYDIFGNVTKQTLALSETPTVANSPIVESTYSVESMEEGVFQVTNQTRYNATGDPLASTQKQLISELDGVLADKTLSIDERGNQSVSWTEYTSPAKLTRKTMLPTSNITAETVSVDGFTTSQDHAGITTTASHSYTATGMTMTQTDGRGNTTTTVMDKAGRPTSVTGAAGNITSTIYDTNHDQPANITDAQGNTACYRYDNRGRKVAEWGTGIQPAMFAYDDADRLISLTTFRVNTGDISTDPGEREDGDTTTWTYHNATGLELRKTYADNSHVDKSYDAFNRRSVETLARGATKTHSYEPDCGLLLGNVYSDGTTARSYQYNHLGQLVQVTDDAGARSIGYNSYGEQETDSLLANGVTHLITETLDAYGRSTGYTYTKNEVVQQTVITGYGTDGRIATAGFLHGGAEKQFGYSYLEGSDLLQTLTMPNNMTLTQSYEANRDLLTGMYYKRGATGVVEREYTYDTLGCPTARNTARQGTTKNDTFAYNNRSELVDATVSGESYSYAYDNIGNRKSAQEAAEEATSYTANALNQYTTIDDFVPTYDADGNQTLVKTTTGIWSVQYNAENRPITFTNNESNTVVECTYDCMGRRATKKVTENGSITLNQRYIYRGYLQIATCDQTRSGHPCLWHILWDPTQPVATRPLAIQKDSTWYTYGWDLTKNVCEIFNKAGTVAATYNYTPYGEVTTDGDVSQPIQWSSEYYDTALGLVYYNYRHYNPVNGRWLNRDLDLKDEVFLLYSFVLNAPMFLMDYIGLRVSTSQSYSLNQNYTWGGTQDAEVDYHASFGKRKSR